MKKFCLIATAILLLATACEKDPIRPSPPPPPAPAVNTEPKVFVRATGGIMLPADFVVLSGWAIDAEKNIASYRWTQLSGPSQATIQDPNSPVTLISKFTKGEYNFELSVTDSGLLSGKAAVNFLVFDSSDVGTNVLVISNIEAVCWGPECTVLVDYSNTNFKRKLPFRIFLRSMGSSDWKEISQADCLFSLSGEWFVVETYGLDDSTKWEVMIRF